MSELDSLRPIIKTAIEEVVLYGGSVPDFSNTWPISLTPYELGTSIHSRYRKDTRNTLIQEIRKIAGLNIFDNKIQSIGSSGQGVTYEDLTDWLVYKSHQFGVDQTLENLKRYISASEIYFYEILAVAGIAVEDTIDIGNGISIVPFHKVPDSWEKHVFTPSINSHPGQIYPTSALICKQSQKVSHERDVTKIPPFSSRYKELSTVQQLLTLFGPSGNVEVANWTTSEEWIPKPGVGGGWGQDRRISEAGNIKTYKFTTDDLELLKKIVTSYNSMPEGDRNYLAVPIGRLNQSLRRITHEDMAVELGIALESLYLLEDEKDEILFKLKTRVTELLGGTRDEKEKRKKVATKLYDMRSQAVHRGKLYREKPQLVRSSINDGTNLVVQTIIKFILEGVTHWEDINHGFLAKLKDGRYFEALKDTLLSFRSKQGE